MTMIDNHALSWVYDLPGKRLRRLSITCAPTAPTISESNLAISSATLSLPIPDGSPNGRLDRLTCATAGLSSSKASKELQSALQDDIKRQAVDTAKKRAVGQHVDYDTFKNMVAVAHLRPLQAPSSTQTVSHAPAWRFAPNGLLAKSADSLTLRVATFDPQTSPVPATSDEFIRVWNRQCPTSADKLRLLSSCGPDHLCKLFRAALPADLLSSILVTLCFLHSPDSGSTGVPAGAFSDMQKQEGADMQFAHAEGVMPGSVPSAESRSDAEFIFDVLHGLSGAGRFALTVRLINQSARKAAIKLSSTLQQAQNVHSGTISYSADQLHQLQREFGVCSTNS